MTPISDTCRVFETAARLDACWETVPRGGVCRFIAGLAKVELHVHHVGSVPLPAIAQLAARQPAPCRVTSISWPGSSF